jgi:hypothetical protein
MSEYTYWSSPEDPAGIPWRRTLTDGGKAALAEYRTSDGLGWNVHPDETVTAGDFEKFGYRKVQPDA